MRSSSTTCSEVQISVSPRLCYCASLYRNDSLCIDRAFVYKLTPYAGENWTCRNDITGGSSPSEREAAYTWSVYRAACIYRLYSEGEMSICVTSNKNQSNRRVSRVAPGLFNVLMSLLARFTVGPLPHCLRVSVNVRSADVVQALSWRLVRLDI